MVIAVVDNIVCLLIGRLPQFGNLFKFVGVFIDNYYTAWLASRGLSKIFTLDRKHFGRFEGLTVLEPGTDL
jgi:hypothetical protein